MMPNDPAFPTDQKTSANSKVPDIMTEGGLTKREYFAIKIYSAIVSGKRSDIQHSDLILQAKTAVECADYLVQALA